MSMWYVIKWSKCSTIRLVFTYYISTPNAIATSQSCINCLLRMKILWFRIISKSNQCFACNFCFCFACCMLRCHFIRLVTCVFCIKYFTKMRPGWSCRLALPNTPNSTACLRKHAASVLKLTRISPRVGALILVRYPLSVRTNKHKPPT